MTCFQRSCPVAIVTGASRGLGRAITAALLDRGWKVVVDARRSADLAATAAALNSPRLIAHAEDITDAAHRAVLIDAAVGSGKLSLLVNNASCLGPTPQPALAEYPAGDLRAVYDVNVFAPLAMVQAALPELTANAGTIVNVSSDAGTEAYAGWGGYGSSKAALVQLSAVLALENTAVNVYAFDPGDMRTEMHQAAFPGQDITDRPEPESVVPSMLRLLDARPPGGRYRASDLSRVGESI